MEDSAKQQKEPRKMNPIEPELEKISEAVIEMIELVKHQLTRSKDALLNLDRELASQINHSEKRVNSMELTIDKYCENTLARFSPVATDLRFVLSMLKINSDLERIGDYADSIADYVLIMDKPVGKDLAEKVSLGEMFDLAVEMIALLEEAYIDDNSKKMKKLFSRDAALNKINKQKSLIIKEYISKKPEAIDNALFVHSTIKKLERVGDHVKNIAENFIFYSDAKVVKHKKVN